MTTAAALFWRDCNRYHALAKEFERNIEIVHPDYLTGRSGYYGCGCSWCATEVEYYTYRGPNL